MLAALGDRCLLEFARESGVAAAAFAAGVSHSAVQAAVTRCTDDADAVARAVSHVAEGGFAWVRLQTVYQAGPAAMPDAVAALDGHLQTLYRQLPPDTFFAVLAAPPRWGLSYRCGSSFLGSG